MPRSDPRVVVFVPSQRIAAADMDVRPTDWIEWVVLAVDPDRHAPTLEGRPIEYLFDAHDLSLPQSDDATLRYFVVGGFVASVEPVAAEPQVSGDALHPLGSTTEVDASRHVGAIVTFAASVVAYRIGVDPDETSRGERLLGERQQPTAILMPTWQLDEEGFDVRPGDRLSWRISTRDPARWTEPLGGGRSVDFLADTYLHAEGAGPAVEMDHGSVQPAHATPRFVRIDGVVDVVETVARVGSGTRIRTVESSRATGRAGTESILVTLRPGAVLTDSPDGDERYETWR